MRDQENNRILLKDNAGKGTSSGVNKTYKLYINGQFARTESGRYKKIDLKEQAVNVCLASPKDVRDAVVAARKSQEGWGNKTAFNRSQIIYRMAEMLAHRSHSFTHHLTTTGFHLNDAEKEVTAAVDLLVHYAGWCDKFQQLHSTVNPVAAPYFNFSVPEPMGVVAALMSEGGSLTGIFHSILPVIAGSNSIVLLVAPESAPLGLEVAELIHTSDVPGGVINILSGRREELLPHLFSHMDINAVVVPGEKKFKQFAEGAAGNLKRVVLREREKDSPGDEMIMKTQEIKTIWHPAKA